jgi:biotin carboxylase
MPDPNRKNFLSIDPTKPVVVVGTTPDYVARISHHYLETALFILDIRHQEDPFLEGVDPADLFFTSFSDEEGVLHSFQDYLTGHHISPIGVACFDCEHLALAGRLAGDLHLPSPSVKAVLHSRNKLETRRLLNHAGLCTIQAMPASGLDETLNFFRFIKNPIIIKPISGGGSELVFFCRNEDEIKEAVNVMEEQLPRRKENPLFRVMNHYPSDSGIPDPYRTWIVEEYISGPEYSCDFIFAHDRVSIIRETGKVKAPDQTFGSVLAYTCPPSYPEAFSTECLPPVFKDACTILGFSWGYFMVDFIIRDNAPFIIEMSPRPGGDSIPDLVKTATNCDTLGIYLDLVCGRPFLIGSKPLQVRATGSLNLYAPHEGRITYLDVSEIQRQQIVKGVFLKKKLGDRITLPPDDYDNRLLGYCIVSLDHETDPIALHQRLQTLIRVSIEN